MGDGRGTQEIGDDHADLSTTIVHFADLVRNCSSSPIGFLMSFGIFRISLEVCNHKTFPIKSVVLGEICHQIKSNYSQSHQT